MQLYHGLAALLLYWKILPLDLQLSLQVAGALIGAILFIYSLRQASLSLRVWLLHVDLSQHFSKAEVREVLTMSIARFAFVPGKEVVNLRQYFKEQFRGHLPLPNPYFLLLGPSGSGKTWFLLRFYIHLRYRWLAATPVKYLSLSQKGSLDQLRFLEKPGQTLLLLDGLDEDPVAQADFVSRMDDIVAKTQGFRAVVMACEHRWFPRLLDEQGGNVSYVGENCVQDFQICELVPLQKWESEQVLRSQLDKGQKGWQAQLAHKPDLTDTPIWLRVLAYNDLALPQSFRFQIFEGHIAFLLKTLSGDLKKQEQMHQFLEAMAGSIYQQWQSGQSQELDASEIERLARVFSINPARLVPFFLQTSRQFYRFRHRSYLAYFMAQAAYREELNPEITQFVGLPLARTFFLEMNWLHYQKQNEETEGYFRSILNLEKRPLADLSSEELPMVNYLYITGFRGQDMRFLRMLRHLKAIHLAHAETRDLEGEWVQELPHAAVLVYLGWDPRHQHLWHPEDRLQLIPLPNGEQASSLKRSFRELRPAREINPLEQIAPGLRKRVQAGKKGVLNLFHLDFKALPDGNCEKIGTRNSPQGGKIETFELQLGFLEFDLFNKAELFVFEDGSFNIIFSHQHRPTLMVEALAEAVEGLFRTYGEDDFHRTLFHDDDRAQLQDGIWLGRRWSWRNTDSYAYPIHLYMMEPDRVNLVICGLQSVPRQQLKT